MKNSIDNHLVILLHGIYKTPKSMKGLESFLQERGYRTLNLGYESRKYVIEEIIDMLDEKIKEQSIKYLEVSFVGFSMGGLVIRAYLQRYKIPNLKNVIMIGTPNKGSEVADFFTSNRFAQKLFGKTLKQLVTDQTNLDSIFGNIYYDCGIIAGNLALDFCYPIMKGNPSDGKVSVASTKIENMTDHITFKLSHWYMMRSKKIWLAVQNFLENSKFRVEG